MMTMTMTNFNAATNVHAAAGKPLPAQTQNSANKFVKTEEKVKQYIRLFKETIESLDPADEFLKKLDIDFVRRLSHIIDLHPAIKSGQSKYIAEKSLIIADVLDMSAEEKTNILYAGLLIQLGKIQLPDRLLTKPFYAMSIVDKYRYLGHGVNGERLLGELTQFKGAITLIRHQYEQYNGQGLPDGLEQHNIPLGSRILSVVSDYIAHLQGSMTGTEMLADAALSQLMIRKENYYDPKIVDIFANVLKGKTVDQIKQIMEEAKLHILITKRWQKGLLLNANKSDKPATNPTVVEISLQQLKLGMKVDSIYFGSEPYARNCFVDQSIIDDVIAFSNNSGRNPIIKIHLEMK
ncbi:MAG: HD-GYP domain-containing protein [Methylobacter sp.]